MKTSRSAWGLILLGLLSRALVVWRAGPPRIELDSAQYDDLARNLATGHGLAYSAPMLPPCDVDAHQSPEPTARRWRWTRSLRPG